MTFTKKIFLLLLIAALPFGAQAKRYLLAGHVTDGKTNEPVELATAALLYSDSTVVTGKSTAEDGTFLLNARKPGQYILKVSFVGYQPACLNVNVAEGTDSLNVGQIILKPFDSTLKTAVVTATVARVEQKEDTTIFNAAAYRVPEGSTLEALVKQLPGVEVSDDGTVKWNGKTVTEFLVNGKDFFKGDTKVAMKNLPTDMVNKIKAYDKKSDYTELTGIDDGEETTVLDISTKRELNQSWVSNIDLAYGTKERYSGRAFVNRFTDQSRITAYGSANNTGDRGFGGPRGFGGSSGLTASKSAGLDFSWENGKAKREAGRFEIGGNVRYNHSSNDLVQTTNSQTFLTSGSTGSYSNSASRSNSSATNVNSSLRLQWSPDSMTNVIFRPSFTFTKNDAGSNSRSGTFNDDPYAVEGMVTPLDSIFQDELTMSESLRNMAVNRNLKETLSDSKSVGAQGFLMVMRRLSSNGRNISLRANGGYTNSKSHSFGISSIKYFQNNKAGDFTNQYTDNPSTNWNYSVRLGYVEPLGKNWFAEVRYEFSHKYSDSDRSLYNLDEYPDGSFGTASGYPLIGSLPATEADIWAQMRDDDNSRYATYKYTDHTATAGIRYNSTKIRANVGVSFNPEETKLNYLRPGQNLDTLVTRQVFNVSPQIRFRYKVSKTNVLEVNYRGSASQPSMTDLLAVVDNSDPLNISLGNPGLKPSWNNNLRMSYRGYNAYRQQGMAFNLTFQQTKNSVSNRMVYDDATGARYTRPENISGNWNTAGNFMFNTGLGQMKNFTISTFTDISYNNAVGYVSRIGSSESVAQLSRAVFRNTTETEEAAAVDKMSFDDYNKIFDASVSSKNTTRTLGVGENLNITYRNTWFDVGLLGTMRYQHSRATLQENYNMDTWQFSYGAQANFNFDWGMSVSTDLRMSSRRGYTDNAMNTNEFLWNGQISQSFLKGNAATVSLQFYDILHQQSNISRAITAQQRSDSWSNAINSYIMLHVIYKLNVFGGKSTGENKDDKDNGRNAREGFRPSQPGQNSMPAMPMSPAGGGQGGGRGGF